MRAGRCSTIIGGDGIGLGAGYELRCLSDGIVERTEGWPQHVRTEVAALFWALGLAEGEIKEFYLRSIQKRVRKNRKESYEACRSDEMREAEGLVAAIMKKLPADGGLLRSMVLDFIDMKFEAAPDHRIWKLPIGLDADLLLDHLIQKGALQPSKQTCWPSSSPACAPG